MFLPGLVSITFRQLSVTEIIALVTQAGLAAVEWGGDVHAPHGDEAQARAVARMGADAGLRVAAYGSYYRVGHPETGPFEAVLASAVALGAPHIRVWPGSQGSDSADEAYFQKVVADSRRIGDLAQAERIGIVYEFHANTLTDTNAAAVRLLQTVDHANVRSLWQPPRYAALADNLAGVGGAAALAGISACLPLASADRRAPPPGRGRGSVARLSGAGGTSRPHALRAAGVRSGRRAGGLPARCRDAAALARQLS